MPTISKLRSKRNVSPRNIKGILDKQARRIGRNAIEHLSGREEGIRIDVFCISAKYDVIFNYILLHYF